MVTINSVSGGKTSAYMAVHYPADRTVFALVCNEDPLCAHPDPAVMRYFNDKLGKWPMFGEFIGTAEAFETLRVIMDLEQMMGREIEVVRGPSWEEITKRKNGESVMLPNQITRFCTIEMKVIPVAWWMYLNGLFGQTVQIGYRMDEFDRMYNVNNSIKLPLSAINRNGKPMNKWTYFEQYRNVEFPLITGMVFHGHVSHYWSNKPLIFPRDSNCQNCFWKNRETLRLNFDVSPAQMQWAKRLEQKARAGFRKEWRLEDVEGDAIQPQLFGLDEYSWGPSCQAGYCTD